MLSSSSDTRRTLMHLFLFTNSAQRKLVSICAQKIRKSNSLSLPYYLGVGSLGTPSDIRHSAWYEMEKSRNRTSLSILKIWRKCVELRQISWRISSVTLAKISLKFCWKPNPPGKAGNFWFTTVHAKACEIRKQIFTEVSIFWQKFGNSSFTY